MINQDDARKAIRNLVTGLLEKHRDALLLTASEGGDPHATWMAAMAFPGDGALVSVSAPGSRKVANINHNPRVEWLFSDEEKHCLVYLNGHAEILTTAEEIREGWAAIPDEEKVHFHNFLKQGIGVSVIRTVIETTTLVLPRAGEKFTFRWDEIDQPRPGRKEGPKSTWSPEPDAELKASPSG